MKRVSAKTKICRRLGVNLWGRRKDPLARKNYGPGQHGQKRRKLSGYALQLAAKQKLKGYYGDVGERQFRRFYEMAERMRGDTAENLVGLLERRLDIVCYRLNFVPTVFAARQLVNHGHVKVNGKRVNIPSYLVKEGDVIELTERAKTIPMVIETQQNPEREVPDYLQLDAKNLKGTFLRVPKFADVPYPVQMEPNLVVEFYSR
ncbi:MAG: 30S ribosomal protein S4 [Geminicoccaceae bacterium]|nr:30S ribosomal protein S4 [Geminicoccaceae bacterium]MCS7267251.1 30S ribosomal protein S4 [Geminicoccaceae bacterium]MCX7629820.1 30S ribosomal protein S4 [Geminicoccaceae bacterium]MDW8123969.1 30S ribosomal protein S4 [Geminicoccaceae bacterium]MDW8340738.1 30S ribosomal protein S4 [Geminicoccaceae bacterium]